MQIVVFGLTISSAWGNGHATLWRGLCRALAARGHRVVFFERDTPYYRAHRDAARPAGCDLHLYADWHSEATVAAGAVRGADVAMVTSYCPDAQAAARLVLESTARIKVFYDLDTPVTLQSLEREERVPYLPADGLGGFDLVLSFAGGRALEMLRARLGARTVAPLYGSVDPTAHHPVEVPEAERYDLSYLGTYSADRQSVLDELLFVPASRLPGRRFAIAGSLYPADGLAWQPNIFYLGHLAPPAHSSFYSRSRITLNVTRGAIAAMGHCPSGRLFEAAGCGTTLLTDDWEGLDHFFEPGWEVLVVRSADDVVAALQLDDAERRRIGMRARERALAQHTADVRARQLEAILGGVHVGNHSGGGAGQPYAAAGVFEGTASRRQPT